MLQLTFNRGLTLTGFRTTRPWKIELDNSKFVFRNLLAKQNVKNIVYFAV